MAAALLALFCVAVAPAAQVVDPGRPLMTSNAYVYNNTDQQVRFALTSARGTLTVTLGPVPLRRFRQRPRADLVLHADRQADQHPLGSAPARPRL